MVEIEPLVQEAVASSKRVLFEGAQGTYLDLDSGTYPYVTSSHPIAGGACLGTGVGPRAIDSVIGVAKAYTTRVGGGPFLTELHDEIGEAIRQKGKEFGTVTGRSRRCGWLDLVLLRHSCRLNSLSGLALTRLDVLSGLSSLKVATAYKDKSGNAVPLPSDIRAYDALEPEYVELPGWSEDLQAIRRVEDLPKTAREYMEFIETETKTPIAILSIGPDRDATIVIRPDLIWG